MSKRLWSSLVLWGCAAFLVQILFLSSPLHASDALLDGVWHWNGSRYNNDTEILAADGREYWLDFQADGSLKIMADCNRVLGTYSTEGNSISIMLGPSTLMACAPGSQDQQFLKDLGGVVVWFLKKDELYLDIQFDTGTMHFNRGNGR